MRATLDILLRDLRARVRDRSALVVGILAPLALTAVFSMTLSGTENVHWDIAYVVPKESGPTATAVRQGPLAALEHEGMITVKEFRTVAAASKAIDDDKAVGGIAIGSGTFPTMTVLRSPSNDLVAMVLRSILESTAQRTESIGQVVIGERLARGQPPPAPDDAQTEREAAQVARQLAALPAPVTLRDESGSVEALTPRTSTAAGMMTFFLMFTVQFGLMGLLVERRTGTLQRLLAAPVTPWQVVSGKLLVSLALGVLSMVVLAAASSLVLGAHFGNPLGVAILILTGVTAATAISSLVIGFATTPERAGTAQAIVAVVLGMLGGSFFSLSRGGGIGAVLTQFTPHYWFGEGLARMVGGGSWTDALGPAAMLIVITLATGIPGLLLARRAVRL